jgi:acyl carrier protein
MTLPEPVLSFLNNNAVANGVAAPSESDDLFLQGVLDSFLLVEFLTVLEENCGIKVPDSDVVTANFQTIGMIETYVARVRGHDV